MTPSEAYWEKLVAANPALRDIEATMRLPVREFMRQIQRAYDAGIMYRAERASGQCKQEDMPDFFRNSFK